MSCSRIFFPSPYFLPGSGGGTTALPTNEIFVGNALNVATPVAMSQDATIVSSGAVTVTGLQTVAIDPTAPTNGQALVYDSIAGKYIPTTPGIPALPDAQIFVGDGTNVAVAVPMSGDATISDSGYVIVVGLQQFPISVTPPVDKQALVYDQFGTSSYVPTTILSPNLASGSILVGSAGGIATGVAMSGDTTITNVGLVKVVALQHVSVDATAPTNGQVLMYNSGTSKWTPSANVSNVPSGTADSQTLLWDNTGLAWVVSNNVSILKDNGSTPFVAAQGHLQVNQIGGLGGGHTDTLLLLNSDTSGGTGSFTSLDIESVGGFPIGIKIVATAGATGTSQGISINATGGVTNTAISVVNGDINKASFAGVGERLISSDASGTFQIYTGGTPVGNTLNSANIFVGNVSNIATGVSVTGDATITNAGAIKVVAIQNEAIDTTAPTNGQVLTWVTGTSKWTPTTPSVGSLTDSHILVGNVSNIATDVAVSGDITLANTGAVTVTGIQAHAVDTTAPTDAQLLVYNNSTSKYVPVSLSSDVTITNAGVATVVGKLTSTLTSANIFVGNVSNVATGVSVTGDATLTNAGAIKVVAIQNEAIDTTAPTNGQVLTWITGTSKWTPTTPSVGSLTDSHILVGNVSNVATDVAVSGDVTLANTGAFTVTKIQTHAVDTTAPTDAQLLVYNNSTSKYVPVSLSSDVTITNAGVATVVGKLTSTLTSANIFVGNVSNVATAAAMTGAITIDNAGATTYNGVVPINKGGTNNTSFTDTRIPFYSNSGTQFIDSANLTFASNILSVATTANLSADNLQFTTVNNTHSIGVTGTGTAPAATTFSGGGATGTNVSAGQVIITTGQSTGTGTGTVIIKTAPAGSSGAGVNAVTATLTLTSTSMIHSGFTTNGIVTTTGGTGTFSVISTLPISQGGTNNTSFTNNAVIYYTSSGTQFVNGSALTFNGTSLQLGSGYVITPTDIRTASNNNISLGAKTFNHPAAATLTLMGIGGSGTNENAGNVFIATGQSSGTGAGTILIQTAPAGVSGSGVNSVTTSITITSAVTSIASLSSNGVVKTTGGTGALSVVASTTVNDVLRGDMTFGTFVPAWTDVTGTTQAMAVNTNYVANNVGLVTLTLPATAAKGDMIRVAGFGAGGWKIALNAGQTVHFNNSSTTTGTGGDVHSSTSQYASVQLLCTATNTDFVVISVAGTIALT